MNQNENQSVEIGEYFAQKRNIPGNNRIYIDCPSVELIDSAGFEDIRRQIEEQMVQKELTTSINYLVTTKGIPFNVRKADDCTGLNGVMSCSSMDSELSLIFSEWNGEILTGDVSVVNPYFMEDGHFSRDKYGIYLVTRLDGYTIEDVKKLIDNSGPGIEVAKNSSQFIIDFSYVSDTIVGNLFSLFVQPAINFLILNDWHVVFDPGDELLTGQSDVLGYFNINYQPSNKELDFDWLKGSLSEIFLSTGNLTFNKDQNVFNELSVPDIIREGGTSASTYANGIFFSQVVQLSTLYERYLDESVHPSYNLAESYFMAMPRLSNQYLVIGDPKTSLAIQQNSTGADRYSQSLVLSPNPANEMLKLSFVADIPGNYKIHVTDVAGRDIILKDVYFDKGFSEQLTDISGLPGGIYFLTLSGPGNMERTVKFIKSGP
jgi:uncharacterized protein (TIGR03790 family)